MGSRRCGNVRNGGGKKGLWEGNRQRVSLRRQRRGFRRECQERHSGDSDSEKSKELGVGFFHGTRKKSGRGVFAKNWRRE